jgi:hypothetical protein
MTWIKLPNVGDSATVTIRQLGDVRDDTLAFSTTEGDMLYLPRAVALARLRDCGFTNGDGVTVNYDAVVGAQLVFAKIAPEIAGGRPRWMIERTKSAVANTHTNGAAPMDDLSKDVLAQRDAKRAAIRDAYHLALAASLETQRTVLKGKGVPKPTAESIQAGAATLLIQYERNRCL